MAKNLKRTLIWRLLGGLMFSAAAVLVSTTMASAAVSWHGDDYSYEYDNATRLKTCDKEADSHKTKGGWSLTPTGSEDGSVSDVDGANEHCAYGYAYGTIERHHTCEKSFWAWSCGNWQAV